MMYIGIALLVGIIVLAIIRMTSKKSEKETYDYNERPIRRTVVLAENGVNKKYYMKRTKTSIARSYKDYEVRDDLGNIIEDLYLLETLYDLFIETDEPYLVFDLSTNEYYSEAEFDEYPEENDWYEEIPVNDECNDCELIVEEITTDDPVVVDDDCNDCQDCSCGTNDEDMRIPFEKEVFLGSDDSTPEIEPLPQSEPVSYESDVVEDYSSNDNCGSDYSSDSGDSDW